VFTLYVLELTDRESTDVSEACSASLSAASSAAPILRSTGASLVVRTVRAADLKHPRVIEALYSKGVTGLPALLVSGTAFVGKRQIVDELRRATESASAPEYDTKPAPNYDTKPAPEYDLDDDHNFLEEVDYDDLPTADNELSLMSKLGLDD